MMADSKLIKEALGAPLLEAGFKKKTNDWYWSNDEVVLLVNLQKSQYGDQYYVNCGVALKCLGAVEFPKEQHCHIRFRLTSLISKEIWGDVDSFFNLENESISGQQRGKKISNLAKDVVLPILQGCSSVSGISEAIRRGALNHAFIHKRVKDLIG